jgi:hypothetical protein
VILDDEAFRALQAQRAAPIGAVTLHRRWLATRLGGWRLVSQTEDGDAFAGRVHGQPLLVLWSMAMEQDRNLWLHVSCSHKARVPLWGEISEVKRLFVGEQRWACQLHPPQAQYVNIHDRCLHLFAPFSPEAWRLPDFTEGTGSI